MIVRWKLGALVAGALALAGCSGETGPSETPNDDGLPPMPEFPDNPTTPEGVDLGRRLFHDPILSGDGTQSCADCHRQEFAFGDPRQFSLGIHGDAGTRNASTIVNPAWQTSQFWDGRAATLEDQAVNPVQNPIEMAADWSVVVATVAAQPDYPPAFAAAFGTDDVTQERIVRAIAQFERGFVSADSKFDRERRGEVAFSAAEIRGRDLFFSEGAECFHCHAAPLFTDGRFHDIGLDLDPPDEGRAAATGVVFDRGKFKTPSLRNVEVSAPYMHDGRFATLEEVLDHYAAGIQRSPNLDPVLGVQLNGGATGLGLTPEQRADLIAFLKALTDPSFLQNPDLGPPSS
ncbi:MAG: cytochrome c peroxidase [bacterium]